MADLYLVALNKQKGNEEQSAALHYLLAKEATRCYPCGDVVVSDRHFEAQSLAECVYYLSELYASGEYGIIRGMTDSLRTLYEGKLADHPEGQKGYMRFILSRDSKLHEYQKCVNDMDLKDNPFARFDGYVKKHRYKQRKPLVKSCEAAEGVEVGSLVEDSGL
jgi:hypothetical protein